jgi:hypothetical protein
MDLVTIKRYASDMEAQLMKARLESEGIYVLLLDEHRSSASPVHHLAGGGVKLQVWDRDIEKAGKIIQESISESSTSDSEVNCPKCGSYDVRFGMRSLRSPKGMLSLLVAILTLGAGIIFLFSKVHTCNNCLNEFK